MSNLTKVIQALIHNYKKVNNEDGLAQISEKIDIFFAVGKLTKEEYDFLIEELK